ncbi:MAG: DUF4870 domain-containing protein [Streptosporangiales bacterium]|nr:DUF4870 domain-containing protein [Streptosporangiales bacterium]
MPTAHPATEQPATGRFPAAWRGNRQSAPRLHTSALHVPEAPLDTGHGGRPLPAEARDGQTAYLLYDQEALAYTAPPQHRDAHAPAPDRHAVYELVDTGAAPLTAPRPRPVEAWPPPDDHLDVPDTDDVAAPDELGHRTSVRRARYSAPPARQAPGRTAAFLVHLGGVLSGCLLPALVYLVARRGSTFARMHSAEAVNFQLTLALGYVGAAIVGVLFTGYLVLVPVWIVGLVFGIQAAMAAEAGAEYHYPFTVRFVA